MKSLSANWMEVHSVGMPLMVFWDWRVLAGNGAGTDSGGILAVVAAADDARGGISEREVVRH